MWKAAAKKKTVGKNWFEQGICKQHFKTQGKISAENSSINERLQRKCRGAENVSPLKISPEHIFLSHKFPKTNKANYCFIKQLTALNISFKISRLSYGSSLHLKHTGPKPLCAINSVTVIDPSRTG